MDGNSRAQLYFLCFTAARETRQKIWHLIPAPPLTLFIARPCFYSSAQIANTTLDNVSLERYPFGSDAILCLFFFFLGGRFAWRAATSLALAAPRLPRACRRSSWRAGGTGCGKDVLYLVSETGMGRVGSAHLLFTRLLSYVGCIAARAGRDGSGRLLGALGWGRDGRVPSACSFFFSFFFLVIASL